MESNKINYTEMNGNELQTIINILNEFRNDLTNGRITQLPIDSSWMIKGVKLSIKISNGRE